MKWVSGGSFGDMTESLFQRFVQGLGLGRPRAGSAREVHVIAFGKHPAWDDHIPSLGTEHPRLAETKSALYQGISGNVDNGAWEKLERESQIEPFGHSFLSIADRDLVAGRLWYSQDGKGRDRYPMAVCVLCTGISLAWAVNNLFPLLQQVQAKYLTAVSASEVQEIQDRLRDDVLELLRKTVHERTERRLDSSLAAAWFASRPEMGAEQEGLIRVLYHLDRELQATGGATKPTDSKTFMPGRDRVASLRLPLCGEPPTRAAELWLAFLGLETDLPTPLFAFAPDHKRHIDIIVGHAGVSQIYCLRAPLSIIPFTSDIPYTIDDAFAGRVRGILEQCCVSAKSSG